ncbi:hypothetical protein COU54_01930 [Candidatus Pacearchaeota archaeon CG10_big_fil_rev_8_21_14_0_10_31_24]|nr:MAG: hypothetical protein COU54_01930 [Candidatus Pacearchaeota archaeon CG10_big_fil_rev_8_21_14_0_10_31_24]
MPYKCVHCSATYPEGAEELVKGCICKRKFFFYIKEDKSKEDVPEEEIVPELSEIEKKQVEEDVREIAGVQDDEVPVFLDFESVKVMKPGKYLLDLGKLFNNKGPRVYHLEDGKYIVDLMGNKK